MTINVGLLGAGWFGREAHLKNLLRLPDVEVVAVSSRSDESRAAAKDLVGDQLQTFEANACAAVTSILKIDVPM